MYITVALFMQYLLVVLAINLYHKLLYLFYLRYAVHFQICF